MTPGGLVPAAPAGEEDEREDHAQPADRDQDPVRIEEGRERPLEIADPLHVSLPPIGSELEANRARAG